MPFTFEVDLSNINNQLKGSKNPIKPSAWILFHCTPLSGMGGAMLVPHSSQETLFYFFPSTSSAV
jgi:hypothetical protein